MKTKEKSITDLSDVVAAFRQNVDEKLKDMPKEKKGLKELNGNPVTLGPRVLTPEEWAEKMRTRAVAAADEWLKRVTRPRKDPVIAAIAAADKRYDKLEEAKKTKKWEKAMEAVDKDLMYKIIETVGPSGFKAGVENRKAKIEARVKELQPLVTAVAETLDKMPVATDADREKKLLAARKLMIELGKKRRGL